MWNSQFVGGIPMSAEDLQWFADYVATTATR